MSSTRAFIVFFEARILASSFDSIAVAVTPSGETVTTKYGIPFLGDDRLLFWSWLYSLPSDGAPHSQIGCPGQSLFDLGSYGCACMSFRYATAMS